MFLLHSEAPLCIKCDSNTDSDVDGLLPEEGDPGISAGRPTGSFCVQGNYGYYKSPKHTRNQINDTKKWTFQEQLNVWGSQQSVSEQLHVSLIGKTVNSQALFSKHANV